MKLVEDVDVHCCTDKAGTTSDDEGGTECRWHERRAG